MWPFAGIRKLLAVQLLRMHAGVRACVATLAVTPVAHSPVPYLAADFAVASCTIVCGMVARAASVGAHSDRETIWQAATFTFMGTAAVAGAGGTCRHALAVGKHG